MQRRDLLPAEVARLLPDDAAIVRSALSTAAGGPRHSHAELLKLVGVDLEEVRSAVRRTFGAEALDSLGRRGVHQPWQPWRRPSRRCTSLLAGTIHVAPRVKQAMERARIDADRRPAAAIAPAALLLGMLEVEDSMANRLLRSVRIEPDAVRQALLVARG
jgi:ATP-dependent Clp protease ATP-binding subunit ClpA